MRRIEFLILFTVWGGLNTANAADLIVTSDDCALLAEHKAGDDVAYQPGITADGDAVVPADLPNAAAVQLPDEIRIPLALNIRTPGDPANLPPSLVPLGRFDNQAGLGQLRYDRKQGKLYYQDTELPQSSLGSIIQGCEAAKTKSRPKE
jgi:hypothetical protein